MVCMGTVANWKINLTAMSTECRFEGSKLHYLRTVYPRVRAHMEREMLNET
jgi:hypothetical protein